MTQQQRLSFLLLVFICGGLYFWRSSQNKNSSLSEGRSLPVVVSESTPDSTSETTSQTASDDSTKKISTSKVDPHLTSLKKQIRDFPKDISVTYREELMKNNHRSPSVLLQASEQLFQIAQSVTNATEAQEAFEFFNQCLIEKDAVIAVQTSCFRHARKISQDYPQFAEKFATLQEQTTEEVLRIVQMDHH